MASKGKTSTKDKKESQKKPGGNLGLKYIKLTKEQCANLETCAMMGLTIIESCAIVGISRRSFYNYCNKNPEYLPKIKMLQKKLIAHAKKNVAFTILSEEGKAVAENSWRFLSHKRELSRIGLEGHDYDPDDGLDGEEVDIPETATYQESMLHLQRLLLPSGNEVKK